MNQIIVRHHIKIQIGILFGLSLLLNVVFFKDDNYKNIIMPITHGEIGYNFCKYNSLKIC